MKKAYIKPITEDVVLNLGERITWGGDATLSNPYNTGDAKQNVIIFEEIGNEEVPDTTDFWYNDSWKMKYNLWDED